jgi:Zn-dependent protease
MLQGKRITLFRLFGFRIQIEWTWLFLAVWLTWSLATNVFPARVGSQSRTVYWWMGAIGALGLFSSIVFHELCHSLVARRYGLPIRGITLFIFGGVAELEDEPSSPKAEFLMALAGPLSSVVLAALCWFLRWAGVQAHWPVPVLGVLRYLTTINASLAAFNLLPAFPLDGGRVLRAALWRWQDNVLWATRVASWIGALLGNLMLGLGTIVLFVGSFVDGSWLIVVGLYLRSASRESYRQMSIRHVLRGEPVSRFLEQDPVVVPVDVSLAGLVQDYVYRHQFKTFPVVDGTRLVGCVRAQALNQVPREEWALHTVSELVETCSAENTISGSVDAMAALTQMSRSGNGRLMVVDGEHLLGVVTLHDLLNVMALRLGMEPGLR